MQLGGWRVYVPLFIMKLAWRIYPFFNESGSLSGLVWPGASQAKGRKPLHAFQGGVEGLAARGWECQAGIRVILGCSL